MGTSKATNERERLRSYLKLYRQCEKELHTPSQKYSDEETAEMKQTVENINVIISFVKIGSKKRKIIEFRYKNGLNWRQIERAMHYARSPLAALEKETLDELIKIEAVRAIVFDGKII